MLAGVVMVLACARSSEAPSPSRSASGANPPGDGAKVWSGTAPNTPTPAGSAFVAEIGETGPFPRIPPLPHGEGAKRMNARLDAIVRNMEPRRNVFLNTARAERLRQDIASIGDLHEQVSGTTFLADELLKAGQIEEAMALIEPYLSPSPALAPNVPPYARTYEFLGLAALRLGETQNCITQHNGESCLVPIKGGGIHVNQEGSRRAIGYFTKSLDLDPGALGVRWLLNLAYMTVGEYPAKVPAKWLVKPTTFTSTGTMVRFRDVAAAAGLDMRQHAGGAIFDDFDGDGLLDLVVTSMGVHDPMRFFHNRGDGRFEERTDAAGLAGEWGGLNVIHADYNNDGWLDLLVLRGGWMGKGGRFPSSLLRNNGDGTFDDVTEEAGIMTLRPTQTAAFADYDGDGWLDLMFGYESRKDDAQRSELWHNQRDGTFRNATACLGPADFGYVKGVAFGDYDNDGRPDLYISVQDGSNHLFHNAGPRTPADPQGEDWVFTDVTEAAGVAGPRFSFPTWFFDYDNDGWLDIMAAAFHFVDLDDAVAKMAGLPHRMEPPALYRNNRDGTFTDVAKTDGLERMSLPMGSNYADFDGDGWLDIYVGTGEPNLRSLVPNQMFRNVEGKRFDDVSVAAGVANIQKGHAIAPADVDNDGDLDFFSEMGGWYEADVAHANFFLNPGNDNAWVTLRLEGRRSNRAALGARILVRVRTAAGTRDIHRVVESGGSFGGGSLQQEIGLGRATAIDLVEVRWPTTGTTQRFENVGMRRAWRIVEGEAALTPVTLKPFKFE
ncbi:MAG TPA: CRTAC1 family protein [Dongiaceae bacterium]|nr:CRTAC1 family protein [Dongiaceae bacterium]